METFDHNLKNLFSQLGLGSTDDQINQFIIKNKFRKNENIEHAKCWSKTQSLFLEEGLQNDSEWSISIDLLSGMMRE